MWGHFRLALMLLFRAIFFFAVMPYQYKFGQEKQDGMFWFFFFLPGWGTGLPARAMLAGWWDREGGLGGLGGVHGVDFGVGGTGRAGC